MTTTYIASDRVTPIIVIVQSVNIFGGIRQQCFYFRFKIHEKASSKSIAFAQLTRLQEKWSRNDIIRRVAEKSVSQYDCYWYASHVKQTFYVPLTMLPQRHYK